jgi:enamine deaminase RidA (YjgF/YER057c/UK114 family)
LADRKQTKVLDNLRKVLELSGSSLQQVVKYNVYLANMDDFAAMNEAYIAVSSALKKIWWLHC